MVVMILGTPYTLERLSPEQDEMLKEVDAYCDDTTKRLVVTNEPSLGCQSPDDLECHRKKQIRHEIVHAFLSESGLAENTDWACNEEIVDWIAMQGPKLYQAWQAAGAI